VQFREHVLGEREVGGGQAGRLDGIPGDDGIGKRRVLAQRAAADLGRVRLGVEPEADLPAGPGTQLDQAGVVRGAGDRLMERVVSQPGRIPASSWGIEDRSLDHFGTAMPGVNRPEPPVLRRRAEISRRRSRPAAAASRPGQPAQAQGWRLPAV
jgi:hypothetical protein